MRKQNKFFVPSKINPDYLFFKAATAPIEEKS